MYVRITEELQNKRYQQNSLIKHEKNLKYSLNVKSNHRGQKQSPSYIKQLEPLLSNARSNFNIYKSCNNLQNIYKITTE